MSDNRVFLRNFESELLDLAGCVGDQGYIGRFFELVHCVLESFDALDQVLHASFACPFRVLFKFACQVHVCSLQLHVLHFQCLHACKFLLAIVIQLVYLLAQKLSSLRLIIFVALGDRQISLNDPLLSHLEQFTVGFSLLLDHFFVLDCLGFCFLEFS